MWTSPHVAQPSGVLTGRTGSGECGGAHGTTSRITKQLTDSCPPHGGRSPVASGSGKFVGRLTHLCELGAQDHLMRVWAGAIRGKGSWSAHGA